MEILIDQGNRTFMSSERDVYPDIDTLCSVKDSNSNVAPPEVYLSDIRGDGEGSCPLLRAVRLTLIFRTVALCISFVTLSYPRT